MDEPSKSKLRSILDPVLLTSIVFYFAIPFVWLSGSTVMAQTGQKFLTSPLHWLHLAALLVGFIVVRRLKSVPVWLPILLILGELLGRIAFFTLMASSGANLGGIY